MIDYCKKHNIPIEREETLKQLMTLTRKTMQEIYKEPKPFWFNSRPEDPTEPQFSARPSFLQRESRHRESIQPITFLVNAFFNNSDKTIIEKD